MKYKLCILLLVVTSLLETYFRETDPGNPSRPTVVLFWLKGYTTQLTPWFQDITAVVYGVGDLLVSPLKSLVEYVTEEASIRPPEQVFLLVYISVWFILGVWVTIDRDAKALQQVDTPTYDKLLQEGTKMLKLQAEKTRLEAEVDRLLREDDSKKVMGTYLTEDYIKAKQKHMEAETKLLIAQKVQQERQKVAWGEETN